jgi:hypothetical protein
MNRLRGRAALGQAGLLVGTVIAIAVVILVYLIVLTRGAIL